MSMVERLIYTVIDAGLDYYKAHDGRRFETFLIEELRLDADEAAKARLYFAGGTDSGTVIKAQPPTLQHGYPRTGGPFPLWAITLTGDRESQAYLGDDATMLDSDGELEFDPDTGEPIDPKILRMEYSYAILCIADHPDITLYYYSLLKRIIRRQRAVFIAADLSVPVLSGADLAPDPRYLPDHLFARQLSLTIQGDECWPEPIEGGYARGVTGIAIDDTGDDETAGDGSVTAKVDPYTES